MDHDELKHIGWRLPETLKQAVIDEGVENNRKPAAQLKHILEERYVHKQEISHTSKQEFKPKHKPLHE